MNSHYSKIGKAQGRTGQEIILHIFLHCRRSHYFAVQHIDYIALLGIGIAHDVTLRNVVSHYMTEHLHFMHREML